jgi:hypothetical protein
VVTAIGNADPSHGQDWKAVPSVPNLSRIRTNGEAPFHYCLMTVMEKKFFSSTMLHDITSCVTIIEAHNLVKRKRLNCYTMRRGPHSLRGNFPAGHLG